jgi:hypothetical protein
MNEMPMKQYITAPVYGAVPTPGIDEGNFKRVYMEYLGYRQQVIEVVGWGLNISKAEGLLALLVCNLVDTREDL